MDFKDFFSVQAKQYSKHRPKYPPELFEFIASLCSSHDTAWDTATGNGQAAHGLLPYFTKIIATDASESQISHAHHHAKIDFHVAKAEQSGLEDSSVDLITVATAIHWINTDEFYKEARRVSKPDGVIAIWSYAESTINPVVDVIMKDYAEVIIGKYWPPENVKAWNFEEMTDFPFKRITNPEFRLNLKWDLEDYLNYLFTWSATQNYIKHTGVNPLEALYKKLSKVWGGDETKIEISWKLGMKIAKVNSLPEENT